MLVPLLFLGSGMDRDRFIMMADRYAMQGAKTLRAVYTAEVGVREAAGNNDGPRVAEYLRYCGLPEGYEWCAAFVSWCHAKAGYTEPRNAWAAALFPATRVVWTRQSGGLGRKHQAVPKVGDVFGIYIPSKKRIAHCGFVDSWDRTWCLTVEGNVDNAVVRKRRSIQTIHTVARWLPHNP